jgi:SOS response regulatory protein OraA/RecX
VPLVTAIRPDRRDRVRVELDGSAWRTFPTAAVVEAGIRPGVELDRARVRELRRALRRQEALRRAAAALSHRDRSTAGLDAVLARRGIGPAQRAEAVETMSRLGYLDDQRYAEGRAAALAGRGYGDEAIRVDLARDDLAGEVIAAALSGLEPELERARRLSRRPDPARAARSLAGRGFAPETVAALFGPDWD